MKIVNLKTNGIVTKQFWYKSHFLGCAVLIRGHWFAKIFQSGRPAYFTKDLDRVIRDMRIKSLEFMEV